MPSESRECHLLISWQRNVLSMTHHFAFMIWPWLSILFIFLLPQPLVKTGTEVHNVSSTQWKLDSSEAQHKRKRSEALSVKVTKAKRWSRYLLLSKTAWNRSPTNRYTPKRTQLPQTTGPNGGICSILAHLSVNLKATPHPPLPLVTKNFNVNKTKLN